MLRMESEICGQDLEIFSLKRYNGGYSGEVPPLPIPNREVKLTIADGTDPPVGRVGSCRFFGSPDVEIRPGIFFCAPVCTPCFAHSPAAATLLRGGNYFSGRGRKNQFPRSALPSSPLPRCRRPLPCCRRPLLAALSPRSAFFCLRACRGF